MFQEMGMVPEQLLQSFRATSVARIGRALRSGEYIGWLASHSDDPQIVAGAGVQRRQVLPHPFGDRPGRFTIVDGSEAVILNVFTEPQWRRRGIARLLMRAILAWAREQRLDGLVLHASQDGRALYQQLGFVATTEMRFSDRLA